jgi:peptide/nickel transport system permease protein
MSIVFLIVRVLPGDPVLLHFEKKATEEQLALMRHALGLDVPIWAQYLNYVAGFFTGNLGLSMQDYSPVAQGIFSAFPATLELAIYAIIIAVLIGILLGSRSAESYNKPVDHIFRLSGIVSYAIPVFFLGMIFQLIFCVGLGWLPVGGRFYAGGQPQGLNVSLSIPSVGFALGFILPSLVTALPLAVSLLIVRKWHTEPKPLDFLLVFASLLASLILYAILIVFLPSILAAPLVTLIPFALVLMLLIQRRGRFQTMDLQILMPVFLVIFLLYGLSPGLVPLLLLSYFVGLLPAYIFLRMVKKGEDESQKIDLSVMLRVLSLLWIEMLLAVFIGSLPTYGVTGDLMNVLVLYYIVELMISLMYLGTLTRRKISLRTKNLLISLLTLSVVWLILILGAWASISAGGLHVKTGLYTIDSILEGSVYDFVQSFRYLLLPSLTLGIVLSGVFLRLTRTNMIETLRLDYVTAAKARGLRRRTVTYGYALRNAFLPVLTMIGLQFAALLGGAVLTETTFSWPGLGRYLVDRIGFRDYTAIEGAVVVFGIFVMIVSLIVDLLYAYLDPRIRL